MAFCFILARFFLIYSCKFLTKRKLDIVEVDTRNRNEINLNREKTTNFSNILMTYAQEIFSVMWFMIECIAAYTNTHVCMCFFIF